MSDFNLLFFGCVVSFIAVAGAYVHLRESWTAQEPSSESGERPAEIVAEKLQDAA